LYQLEKNAFHKVFAQYLETEFSDLHKFSADGSQLTTNEQYAQEVI